MDWMIVGEMLLHLSVLRVDHIDQTIQTNTYQKLTNHGNVSDRAFMLIKYLDILFIVHIPKLNCLIVWCCDQQLVKR